MVEFCDGAVLAQMANPDMRMCIQYALSYPERVAGSVKPMNFSDFLCLTFEKPDESVFKPLALAKFVLQQGGILPAVLNGVNDEAVALFLDHKISFLDIGDLAEKIVRETVNLEHPTVFDILRAGEQAKERVHAIID
jgi:1-deoxy-D-xylulose-5-phosphate reductoisomerase